MQKRKLNINEVKHKQRKWSLNIDVFKEQFTVFLYVFIVAGVIFARFRWDLFHNVSVFKTKLSKCLKKQSSTLISRSVEQKHYLVRFKQNQRHFTKNMRYIKASSLINWNLYKSSLFNMKYSLRIYLILNEKYTV